MPSHRFALLFALLLPACTAHEETTTPTPAARIEVKVASVQLVQDCSDPPGDATAEAAAAAAKPSEPAQAQSWASTPRVAPAPGAGAAQEISAGASLDGSGPGWSPPCTQSTMQLSIANVGDREGKVRVEAVRLFDARGNKELGKIQARKPSQWNPAGTYQPWNESIVHGTTVKVGYRLGEPDWSAVNTILGGETDPYARPYVLEIDISIDGVSQTVRSPEFVREPVHVIAT